MLVRNSKIYNYRKIFLCNGRFSCVNKSNFFNCRVRFR